MLYEYLNVLIFIGVGVGMVILTILASKALHPKKYTKEKMSTYECGEEPVGDAWVRFNNRFYVIALIFVIFSIEVVFLFPWALVFKKLGMFAFIEMMLFLMILLVGFAYVWVKGDLDWVKDFVNESETELFKDNSKK